jgi:ABC-type nitrate/sulfonate/bicarbonate transport system substrate-binding protein
MPFREMGDAFRAGAIVASSTPDPFADELERDGLGRIVDRGSLSTALPAGERVMIAGLATEASWLDRHREQAHRLAAATGRAIDELSAAADGPLHTPLFDRVLEPPDLQRVYDLAFEHGLIPRQASAADLISTG